MALRPRTSFTPLVHARRPPQLDGAWWPRSRTLADELPAFFTAWPAERGRIHRVLFSSPDWDDHPRSVTVGGRRVKTGTFPRDDTRILAVSLEDRTDHLIQVIPASTYPRAARRILATFTAATTTPAATWSVPRPEDDGDSP